MVIEHKILLCSPFNNMSCNELPVKGLALVSGVWKVVNTGNEVLGNIGGRKEAMGPQDYFTLHF